MKKKNIKNCPCGLLVDYSICCGLYLNNPQIKALTPEALMRSRYTAYTLANISYIKKTMRGKALCGFNEVEARLWSKKVDWTGLQIIKTSTFLNKGYVEFIASFIQNGKPNKLHENSEFIYEEGAWFYVDGTHN